MTTEKIADLIGGPDYDFLRNNEHLGERLMFLTLGGSHAYGTNVETSDVDIRGCAMNSDSDIFGLSNFECYVDEATDTTIYGFNKLIHLLVSCNPNTIEMLGGRPEHYLWLSREGKEMIDNRKLFLSKRAIRSFGGYANAQLNRLENALAHDRLTQASREEHIRRSMENAIMDFETKYSDFDLGSIRLFTDKSAREDLDREIFVDVDLKRFPARQFVTLTNEMSNILKTYDKLNHRNNKKDDAHLNKHAMHLIRLYLMCLDILEKEEIITYREADHNLLMSIRNGEFMLEDGTYRPEFFEMVKDFEKRVEYAKENTSLPDHPDMKKVEEFVMSVNRGCF